MSNILAFQKHLKVSTPFLRVPLYFFSDIFGGAPNFMRILISFSTQAVLEVPYQSSQKYPILSPGCLYLWTLWLCGVLGVLLGLFLFPWITSERGFKSFEGNDLWWKAMYWEVFSLNSGTIILLWRSSCWEVWPSLQRALFLVAGFPILLSKKKVKIEAIEKLRLYLLFQLSLITHNVV